MIKKINGVQLRTVTYSCVLARVLLRFCGFRSRTQKKLNRFKFLRILSRTVCKKSAYTCVQLRTHPRTVADSCVLSTQTVRDLGGKAPVEQIISKARLVTRIFKTFCNKPTVSSVLF